MALFRETDLQFLPEELEFSAEDELITIVPNFSLPSVPNSTLTCIGGDYGPFQPNIPVQVPLWLAFTLHKRKKCRIQAPDWLQPENLQGVYEEERNSSAVFQPLPFYYLEIAYALFKRAKTAWSTEDDLYRARDLVESIRKVRMSKMEAGLKQLNGAMTVKMNNVSAMECNTIRPFFQGVLDHFQKLENIKPEERGVARENIAARANANDASQTQAPARQLRKIRN